MHRRNYLATIGSLTILAGCTGSDTKSDMEDTEGSEGVQQLVSETLKARGLTTTVSEEGNQAAFGLKNGDIVRYDDSGESSYMGMGVDRSVSHLHLSEKERQMVIAWMDGNAFGGLSIDSEKEWAYEYDGIWDIDTTPDIQSVAAVSSPIEGTGSTSLVVDGDIAWMKQMADSVGLSVAVADNGAGVVAGGGKYWRDGEQQGVSGVYYYGGDGGLQWFEETETDVISIGYDDEGGLIVAGTDDGKLLALDEDGDVRWQDEELGGFISLSDDGSTVMSAQPSGIVALNASGEKRWSADSLYPHDFETTSDGSRVIVGSRGDGGVAVVDRGEEIWSKTIKEGPVVPAISDDGTTWSVIVMDSDEEIGHARIYRDS